MLSLPGKATGQVGVVEICPCMVELLELYCNAIRQMPTHTKFCNGVNFFYMSRCELIPFPFWLAV